MVVEREREQPLPTYFSDLWTDTLKSFPFENAFGKTSVANQRYYCLCEAWKGLAVWGLRMASCDDDDDDGGGDSDSDDDDE